MKTCSRRWKDTYNKYKCLEEATEVVNGKHLCHHHAKNTLKRMRAKERMRDGTYGTNIIKLESRKEAEVSK